MQEDQTVSFSPMYVDGPEPWIARLFALYILVVLVVFSVRVIKLLAALHRLHRVPKRPLSPTFADSLWAECCAKARSFKDISALTFLASLLNATWLIANVFLSVRAEKEASLGYVVGRVGDGLTYLAPGLIICIALYSAAMIFQASLKRRKPSDLPVNEQE